MIDILRIYERRSKEINNYNNYKNKQEGRQQLTNTQYEFDPS